MNLGIQGRVALIGASGRGIGLAAARRLSMEGCDIAICDKEEGILGSALEDIKKAGNGNRVFAYKTDLRKAEDIAILVASVNRQLGPVSILITNSGGPPPGSFKEIDDETWISSYHQIFLSAVRLIRAVLPDMKAQQWGRIINITSRSLKEPIPNLISSNALRLAVGGMAKTLSREVAQFKITVNNVCPGSTRTDRAIELIIERAKRKGISVEVELEELLKEIPMGRQAEPEEQAAAIAFLASELAGYITGISLLVDGGATRGL